MMQFFFLRCGDVYFASDLGLDGATAGAPGAPARAGPAQAVCPAVSHSGTWGKSRATRHMLGAVAEVSSTVSHAQRPLQPTKKATSTGGSLPSPQACPAPVRTRFRGSNSLAQRSLVPLTHPCSTAVKGTSTTHNARCTFRTTAHEPVTSPAQSPCMSSSAPDCPTGPRLLFATTTTGRRRSSNRTISLFPY